MPARRRRSGATLRVMAPIEADRETRPAVATADWIGIHPGPLPVAQVLDWVVRPGCGALVVFCGTVRDHSDGRPGVSPLEYEAYRRPGRPRLTDVAAAHARARWPVIGRLVLLHRVGRLRSVRSPSWSRPRPRTGARRSRPPTSASTRSSTRSRSGSARPGPEAPTGASAPTTSDVRVIPLSEAQRFVL